MTKRHDVRRKRGEFCGEPTETSLLFYVQQKRKENTANLHMVGLLVTR